MVCRRRRVPIPTLLVLTVAFVVGCTHSNTPRSSSAAPQDVGAQTVKVLGLWSGPELDSFMAVKSAWQDQTHGRVDWQGTENLAETLPAAIRAGNSPDIAVLPNPGLLHQLAQDGSLVPLDSVLDMNQVTADYAPAWLDLGSDSGKLYGLFYKVTDKSTVWYNPKAFTASGYEVPTTWDGMISLADRMVAEGRTPFSVVAPASPAAGWALTDWVSQIVLSGCGPDRYDAWVAGRTPWTDPCIRRAFDRFDQIVHRPGYVLGGTKGILSTTDAAGSYPMYTDRPTVFMYYMASFAQAFIASQYPNLTPGQDYDAFAFPTIAPAHARTVMIGADMIVMVNDTPAARSFMTYLAGTQSQKTWIARGGFTSVNRSVPLDAYADPVARSIAKDLVSAPAVRFSAGDTMPASVQRAWWNAMVQLVQDPRRLDPILRSLTAAARDR
jgi:alpha-glucoside transport system substrate-binding protein